MWAKNAVVGLQESHLSIFFDGYHDFSPIAGGSELQILTEGNTKIFVYRDENGIPSRLQTRRLKADAVETADFVVDSKSNELLLVGLNKRPLETYFNESDDMFDEPSVAPRCELKVDPVKKTAENVKAITSQVSKCAKYSNSVGEALGINVGLGDKTKGLLNCIESNNFKNSEAAKDKTILTKINQLLMSQASLLKSKDQAGLISVQCLEGDLGKKMKAPAKANESGEIYLNFESSEFVNLIKANTGNKKLNLAVSDYASNQTAHELLHLAGIPQKDEKLVNRIIETCEDLNYFNKQTVIGLAMPVVGNAAGVDRAKAVGADKGTTWTLKPIVDDSKIRNGGTQGAAAPVESAGGVNRASRLAASANAVDTQSAPEINQLIKADPNPARTASLIKANELETVVAESQERSAPLRKYVNAVMDDAIPKAEASGRLASASSVDRSPASSGERERYQKMEKSETASSSSAYSSKSTLGKTITGRDGEKYTVVEEYLADGTPKSKSSVSTRSANSGVNGNFKPSVSQSEVAVAVPVSSASPVGATNVARPTSTANDSSAVAAAAAAPSPSMAGATTSAIGGGGSSGSRAPASVASTRMPASAAGAQATNDAVTATTEYIKSTPYTELRSQYRNPDFKQKLIDADITIMNSEGRYIGVPKGSIRYLDKGDRIIRMK